VDRPGKMASAEKVSQCRSARRTEGVNTSTLNDHSPFQQPVPERNTCPSRPISVPAIIAACPPFKTPIFILIMFITPAPRKDLSLTKTLPADDLAPNLWITLRERLDADGRPIDLERFEFRNASPEAPEINGESDADSSDESPTFMMRRRNFPVPPGTPLKVLASSVPYIYVSVLAPDGDEAGPVILDVRKHPVVRLDDSVPEAIQRFARAQARKARRQAAREVEEKAMRRQYLSQAFKDVDAARPEGQDDHAPDVSSGPDDGGKDRGRVTDRRRSRRHDHPDIDDMA